MNLPSSRKTGSSGGFPRLAAALLFCLPGLATLASGAEGELISVNARLVPLDLANARGLTRLELLLAARKAQQNKMEPLFDATVLAGAGCQATTRYGRELYFPDRYSETQLLVSASDGRNYSIPKTGDAPGDTTYLVPPAPLGLARKEIGFVFTVLPSIDEDGHIRLKGSLDNTVFLGFQSAGDPVTVARGFQQKKKSTVSPLGFGPPVFREISSPFDTRLPKHQSDYPILVELGDPALGLPHTKPWPNESTKEQLSVTGELIHEEGIVLPRFGILILNAKRVEQPAPTRFQGRGAPHIFLPSKFMEFEGGFPEPFDQLAMTDPQYQVFVRTANQKKGVDLLSAPSVMLRPKNQGNIEVAREFIFPSSYDPPRLSFTDDEVTVEPSIPREFQKTQVGVSLQVTAENLDFDRIRLRTRTLVREFEGYVNFGRPVSSYRASTLQKVKQMAPLPKGGQMDTMENRCDVPVFPIRSTETELIVPNGASVIVTAFQDVHVTDVQKSIPLSRLRKPKLEQVERSRGLAVVLSPKLVDSAGKP